MRVMITNNYVLVLIVASIILMVIGFGLRDRNPGLILLGSGFLIALYLIVQKAIEVFG